MKTPALLPALLEVLRVFVLLLVSSVLAVAQDREDVLSDPRIINAREFRALALEGTSSFPVIVNLHRPLLMRQFTDWRVKPHAEDHRTHVAALLEDVILALPPREVTIDYRLRNQPSFTGQLTLAGLEAVLSHHQVESVEFDRVIHAQTDQGITLMNADPIRSAYDGSGLSIAIVDTGIDYNHPALGNGGFPNAKVIGGEDFTTSPPDRDPMDEEGHGTSVAGIAAGDIVPDGDYIGGVAPGARLYALRAQTFGQIACAWDWCVEHQDDNPANPILIINNSNGGFKYTSPCTEPCLTIAAQNAISAGMTLFCAAGNDGYSDALSIPACLPEAVSVGAVYDVALTSVSRGLCVDLDVQPDDVACYSNSAAFLDLLAPGHIARAPTLNNGYCDFGATSAASPYAAGAGALLVHAARDKGANLSPSEVRLALTGTGDLLTDPKSNQVTPRINLQNAVDAVVCLAVDENFDNLPNGSVPSGWTSRSTCGSLPFAPCSTVRVEAGASSCSQPNSLVLNAPPYALQAIWGQIAIPLLYQSGFSLSLDLWMDEVIVASFDKGSIALSQSSNGSGNISLLDFKWSGGVINLMDINGSVLTYIIPIFFCSAIGINLDIARRTITYTVNGVRFDVSIPPDSALLQATYPWVVFHQRVGVARYDNVSISVPGTPRFRNANSNPASFIAGPANIGRRLDFIVDLTTTGHSMAVVLGFDSPFQFALSGGQTLLALDLQGNGEMVHTPAFPGPIARPYVLVPDLPQLAGIEVYTQAVHAFGVVPFALSNAQDIVIRTCP